MITKAQADIYTVKAADRRREQIVPYYEHAATVFKRVMGVQPSRNSLTKYIHEKPGFPVQRGGPYVEVPVFYAMKRPYTTIEAMDRFIRLVVELELDLGIEQEETMPAAKRRLVG